MGLGQDVLSTALDDNNNDVKGKMSSLGKSRWRRTQARLHLFVASYDICCGL